MITNCDFSQYQYDIVFANDTYWIYLLSLGSETAGSVCMSKDLLTWQNVTTPFLYTSGGITQDGIFHL